MLVKINFVFVIFIIGITRFIEGNGRSCEPPCLYMIGKRTVKRLPLNKSTGLPSDINNISLIHNKTYGTLMCLEVDIKNDHIYWSDSLSSEIVRSNLDGTDVKTLFHYAIGAPTGLSVDWSSNILYWADRMKKTIELSDTDGKNRKILWTFDNTEIPMGLCAVPTLGYLFWSDHGTSAKIERSSLSGLNRTVLVSSDIKWPHDLIFDYPSNRLYWIDSYMDKISSINPDGSDRQMHYKLIYHKRIAHPYGLAYVSKHHLAYVADWYSLYVLTDRNVSQILINNTGKSEVHQVRIVDGKNITAESPCLSQKNKCSHLCLKRTGDTHECACPTGMELSKSSQTLCIESQKDYEIFFADSHAKAVSHVTKFVNQPGSIVDALPVTNNSMVYPVALDYDPIGQFIYWSDYQTDSIYRMQKDGSNFRTLFHAGANSPGIAVDKITNSIYWVGEKGKSIMKSSMDGKYHKTILSGLSLVIDIVLYEQKGLIFFSDYSGRYIGRINTDGSNLIRVGDKRRIFRVTGMAVDPVEERLYFVTYQYYTMESTDINFKNYRLVIQKTHFRNGRIVLLRNSGSIVRPYGVSLLGEQVFWTDTQKKAIYVANKHSGADIEFITAGLDSPKDIHVYSDRPRTEKRKIYKFSYAKATINSAWCYSGSNCSSPKRIPDPAACPAGYKQTRYGSTCSKCSDPVGASFRCPCTDWKTCAQRGYAAIHGCRPTRGLNFMYFKVRECVQVVKPGFCPFTSKSENCSVALNRCLSDEDCHGDEKCCSTKCSSVTSHICRKPSQITDHPCNINNGGCSHFCIHVDNDYKCDCPDQMRLDKNMTTCVMKKEANVTDICALPSEYGPCQPFIPYRRWYFNEISKKCEQFTYGGCKGNRNNFYTKVQCEVTCSGQCPPIQHEFGTCDVMKNHCFNNTDCPGQKLCCMKECGKSCQDPFQEPMPKCHQDQPSMNCKQPTWYFDAGSQSCKMKQYGGCDNTTENKFNDQKSCFSSCSHVTCEQPPDRGPCRGSISRYYYEKISKKCRNFTYGGCLGNTNNFNTMSSCESFCRVIKTTTTTKTIIPPETTTKAGTTTTTTKAGTTATTTKATSPKSPITTSTKSSKETLSDKTTDITVTSTLTTTKITSLTLVATTENSVSSTTTTTTTTTTKAGTTTTTTKATSPTTSSTTTSNITSECLKSSPCKNGGTCTLCFGACSVEFSCNCTKNYYGEICDVYAGDDIMAANFEKMSSKNVNQSVLVSSIARYISKYCREKNSCEFVEGHSIQTRKRRSTSYYKDFDSSDIDIIDYQETERKVTIQMLVLVPSYITSPRGFMKKNSVNEMLNKYGNNIARAAGLSRYMATEIPTSAPTKSNNTLTKSLTSVSVVIIVVSIAILIVFLVKRHRQKHALKGANTTVRISFENNLYDDLYPDTAQLPASIDNANNISYGNPAYITQLNINAVHYADAKDNKDSVKEWIKFPDDDKTVPFDPYVKSVGLPDECTLYEDPPAYTSRVGTPMNTGKKIPSSAVSAISLGSLPSYSSIWTPEMTELSDVHQQQPQLSSARGNTTPSSAGSNAAPPDVTQIIKVDPSRFDSDC